MKKGYELSFLTQNDLKLKAVGVNFAIFTGSDMITKDLQKSIKNLSDLNQEEINKIFLIVSYVTLFQTQKFFWKGPFEDEEKALIFEKYLFEMFKKTIGVDPAPFIKDMVDYIRQGEPTKETDRFEIQYIGSKICKELNKEDPTLMLEIVTVYSTFLLHGFFESIKQVWEFSNDELEEMLKKIDN